MANIVPNEARVPAGGSTRRSPEARPNGAPRKARPDNAAGGNVERPDHILAACEAQLR
jgi:hypothetical protein